MPGLAAWGRSPPSWGLQVPSGLPGPSQDSQCTCAPCNRTREAGESVRGSRGPRTPSAGPREEGAASQGVGAPPEARAAWHRVTRLGLGPPELPGRNQGGLGLQSVWGFPGQPRNARSAAPSTSPFPSPAAWTGGGLEGQPRPLCGLASAVQPWGTLLSSGPARVPHRAEASLLTGLPGARPCQPPRRAHAQTTVSAQSHERPLPGSGLIALFRTRPGPS